jgi:hypothetical protein
MADDPTGSYIIEYHGFMKPTEYLISAPDKRKSASGEISIEGGTRQAR